MVGIFTGLGAGFERGSGASLGGVGLLGGGALGRSGERVFVNAATGNLVISQRDEFLIGRGPDAEIARTYNSFGALDENGDHWRQSTDRRVFGLTGTVNTAGSTIKRVSADGSEITYAWTGSDYQTTDGAGAHDRLSYNGSVWTWTDGDSQWTETYSAYGSDNWRITSQSDTSGNTLSFTYTGDKLTRVTTADGAYIEYSWSGSNITQMVTGYTDLATSTAQTLTRTRYGYDGSNRLTTVTVDLTPEDNSVTDGNVYTTTYTYHGTSKRIATIAQTDGSLLAIQYDGSGRVTQLTQTVAGGETRVTGFAYGAGTTSVTDPRGQVTKLLYDAAGQLTGIDAPPAVTGAAGQAARFTYDGAGNVTQVRSGTVSGSTFTQISAISYAHDAAGNIIRITDANGNKTDRFYDEFNKLILETVSGASSANRSVSTGADTGRVTAGDEVVLDVLANDIDPDGNPKTITHIGNQAVTAGQSVRLSGGGVVVLNANGTLTYRAPSDQAGNVTFSYTVSDGTLSSRGLVTVTVDGAPNSPPLTGADSASVYAGQSVVLDVLANDIDPEGATLVLSSLNGVQLTVSGQVVTLAGGAGTATWLGGGLVRYTAPAGHAGGSVPFGYTVSDGTQSASGSVTVSVLAAATAHAPFARDDAAVVMAGQTVTFDPRLNDADPEGGALTITHVGGQAISSGGSVTLAGGGVVTLNPDGTLSYAAPAGQAGAVSFGYTVTDGQALTATATVNLSVIANTSEQTPQGGSGTSNSAPVAADDVAGTVVAGQSLMIHALVNDQDADGDTLTITHVDGQAVSVNGSVTLSGGGVVTLNPDGTLSYGAPTGQTGAVSFAYTVSDGTASDTANVALTVIAAGGGGGTYAVSETLFEDEFSYWAIAYNQSSLTSVISTEQANSGTSSLKVPLEAWSDGGVYAPRDITPGQNSILQFWVRREAGSDGGLILYDGNWAEIALGASNNQYWTINGVAGQSGTAGLQVGAWHRIEVDLAGLGVGYLNAFGWRAGSSSSSVVYIDDVSMGYLGAGSLANQPPVAVNDVAGSVTAGQSLVINALANDSDPENDPLTITHVNSQAVSANGTVTLPGGGVVTLNTNGTLSYAAPSSQSGPVSFTYTVSDGSLLATGLVSLNVTAVSNSAPVAADDVAGTVVAGQSLVIHALVNDQDADGDALTITHVDGQAVSVNGSVTLSGGGVVTLNPDGTLSYGAPTGQTGAVSFAYTVSDGTASDTANVALTVIAAGGGGGSGAYTAADVLFADALETGTALHTASGSTSEISTELAQSGSSSVKVTAGQWAQGGLNASRSITTGQNSVLQFWIRREAGGTSGSSITIRHGSWTALHLNASNNDHWSVDGQSGQAGASVLQLGVWHRIEVDLEALGVTQLQAVTWYNGSSAQAVVYLDTISMGSIGAGGSSNQPPVVVNDVAGSVTAGQSLVINALANDSDPENDPLTITHVNGQAVSANGTVTLPGGGVVTLNTNGTLSYAAPSSQSGPVSFTYTVSDGSLLATGLVSLNVTAASSGSGPAAGADAASVYAGQSVILDVLSNDAGTGLSLTHLGGVSLTVSGQVVTLAGGAGTATWLGGGLVRYTAPAGHAGGSVPFGYTVSDGTQSASGSVTVSVLAAATAHAPFARDDAAIVMAGQAVTFDPRLNDADPEGGALTITHVGGQAISSGGSVTLAGGGVVTLNPDGTLSYAAPAGQAGAVSFGYTVTDGQALTATAAVTLSVIANTSAGTPTIPGGGGGPLPATFVAASDIIAGIAQAINYTPANGQTRFVHDGAGRVRYAISGAGNVTEFRYTAAGQLQYEISYPDHAYATTNNLPTVAQMDSWRNALSDRSTTQIFEYRYDARGNLRETVNWGAATTAGGTSNAEGYGHQFFTYDQSGQLLSRRTSPDSFSESFVYDGLGRLVASTDLSGGTTTIAFQDAATTTVVTTGAGHVITSVYNKAGDLISQTDSGSDSASTAQTSYLYDKNGQVRRTAVRTGRTGDERIDYTYHLYDKAGRKIADINHIGEVSEYRYDAAGRIIATVRYTNRLTAAQITSLGNPDGEIELASIRPANHSYDIWQWTIYDTGGRVIRTVQGDGSVTRYEYDDADRLIATYGYHNKISVSSYMNGTSLGPTAAALPAAHANDTVTRTFHDVDGRMIGVLNAEGHLSRLVYDQAGRKVEETVYANPTNASLRASGTYQQLWNSVTKDSAKDITTRYVYDGQGLLRYTIDALNRVTEYTYFGTSVSHANGVVRSTVQYAAPLGSLASYTHASVKAAVAALASSANDRSAWNIYNARGQLSYAIDASGAVTGFSYDSAGRVTKAVQYAVLRATPSLPTIGTMDSWAGANSANARTTRTYYSARGEVLATVDAEGYVTRNWYDAQGRIWDSRRYELAVSATDAWTISNVDSADKGTFARTQYRYDRDGNLVDVYAPDGTRSNFGRYATGLQAWETIALGQGADEARTLLIYDQAGRVREKRYYTAATYVDGTSAHIKELYTYDGFGNLATVTDPNGTVTSYTYDKLGRVLTETRASGQAEAATTTFQYDAFGRVVKVTDARGNASFSYYDQASRVIRTVDAENYLTLTDYTAFGEVASVTRRYNKVSGTPNVTTPPALPATHALDATTSYTYDKLGRLLRATDALGGYDEYTYNAFSDTLTHRNKLEGVTSYQYDRLGRRTSETLPALVHNSAGTQVATTIINTFAYDSRGNLTKKTEADGRPEARVTVYAYDTASRLTKAFVKNLSYYADGTVANATLANVDDFNNINEVAETFVYDRRGNVIEQTDASGTKTQTWYDKLGRVTHQLVQQNGTQGTLTRHFYDANGNVTEARVYAALVTLPANATGTAPAGSGAYRVTTFVFDRLNRMTSSTVPSIQTAVYTSSLAVTTQGLTTSYLYDAMGNVIRVTDPNGGQVHSYYDKLGRKVHEVDQERYRTLWEYNAQNNVTRERRYAQPVTGTVDTATPGAVTNNYPLNDATSAMAQTYQDRVTDYTYDRLGRKLTETRQGVLVFNGTNGFAVQNSVVSFTYNGLGQVLTKTEAADAGTGATNTYVYDSIGRLTSESRKAFTDFNGNSVTPTVDYYYDAAGSLVRQRERGTSGAAARITTYTYGSAGRLTSVKDADVADPDGFVRTFLYDKGGRIVREEYTRVLGTTGFVQEGIVYHYDAQGRITEQFVAARAGNGTYNAAADDQRSQSQYNAFGEVSARGINGVYAEQFRYDNVGRLIATSAGDGIWKYFLYDRNGNQTLAITSSGMNIQDQSMSWVLGRWANTGAIATAYVAGINATITLYDGRGLATEVREPQRERSSGARETYLTSREYNAFGDVVSESNALGHTVDYKHNTMGRLIRTESPQVNVTGENGTTTAIRPTEFYYYDRSGRLVASRDANGNLTRQTLLSGTGFGGTEALVTQTIYADGGIVNTAFDIHGNARRITDQLSRQTTQTFDRVGRLTNIGHAGGLSETFVYDGLGQQIQRWNSLLGSGVKETTLYDRQGRIQTHIAMGGDTTSYAYTWNGSYAISGFGPFGGWQTITTYANTKTLTVQEDQFGRTIYKNDLGGNVSTFSYNAAGNLTAQAITPASGAGQTLGYTYFNTGKLASQWRGTLLNEYTYDKAGNLTGEVLKNGAIILSSQTSTYDALGRMLTWSEAGSATLPASSITWKYDANGNIRSSSNTFLKLNGQGQVFGSAVTDTYWYRFDAMNSVVVDKGQLIGNQIVRGTSGISVMYDLAGQRKSTLKTSSLFVQEFPEEGPVYYYQNYVTREDYIYNTAGNLIEVKEAQSAIVVDYGDGSNIPADPTAEGTRRATFNYDLMGRQTRQTDYAANGTTSLFDQHTLYNTKGQVVVQDNYYRRSDGIYLARNWQYYAQTNYQDAFDTLKYALGAVTHLLTQNFKLNLSYTPPATPPPHTVPSGTIQNASATTTTYDWYDGAAQKQIIYLENVNSQGGPLGGTVARTTTHTNDAAGVLTSAGIADGRPRTVTYTSTATGQTIRRSEADNQPSNGDPHEVWYRFGGKELGYTGNNGTLETGYATSIGNRMAVSSGTGAFRNGATTGIAHTAFDPSLDKVNSYNQGSSAGGYTVRAGETLGSIAANLWGDSSLWYKLAQANGLSGEAALSEGQSLRIPAGVMKSTHNASTFKPYDPAETLGDTAPTAAKPPKKNKCGAFGQVLLVVIAAVVAFSTQQYLIGAEILKAGFAASAVAGAAGSVASQAVGVATGIQEKFSWNSVALAAVSAGISGGSSADTWRQAAVNGVRTNIATQGVGMALGLQKKFSWAGVAASGVGGAIGHQVSKGVDGRFGGGKVGAAATTATVATASSIANAATRSAIEGSNFGDNIRASIPDIIGQTLASAITTESLRRDPVEAQNARQANHANAQVRSAGGGANARPGAGTSGIEAELMFAANEPGLHPDYHFWNTAPQPGHTADALGATTVNNGIAIADELRMARVVTTLYRTDVRAARVASIQAQQDYRQYMRDLPQKQLAYGAAVGAYRVATDPGNYTYYGNGDSGHLPTLRWQSAQVNIRMGMEFDKFNNHPGVVRAEGAIQTIGGLVQTGGGAVAAFGGGATSWTGAGAIVGVAGVVNVGLGIDNTQAGVRQLISGTRVNTGLYTGLVDVGGLDPGTAAWTEFGVNLAAGGVAGPRAVGGITGRRGGAVEFINPAELRWTQTSAGGGGRTAIWRERLDPAGTYNAYPLEPIDVVRTADGLTTVDHTRAAVALEYGITDFPARVWMPSDPLPKVMIDIERFGPNATTWGEAAAYRALNQKPPLPPTGTPRPPRLR